VIQTTPALIQPINPPTKTNNMKIQLSKITLCLLFLLTAATTHAQYYLKSIAGNDSLGYAGDGGPARQAALFNPGSICRNAAGNLYIGDGAYGGLSKYMRVRKIDAATGNITTIAGDGSTASAGDSVDNAPATTAKISKASGICIDKNGDLLLADGGKRIRKVNLTTGIISTIAGNITLFPGYSGDGGPATAAQFFTVVDVAVDNSNNVYIADVNNGAVRKVNAATGIINTIAGIGTAGYSGDGGLATNAKLRPWGIYIDTAENIYIAERYNARIRKVSATTGIITTIAGSDTATTAGDGGPATNAKLGEPTRVTMDRQGNLFFTDIVSSALRIRKIDATTGIITTIGGTGFPLVDTDTAGENGPATAISMGASALCMDTCGNIFVTCRFRVRAMVTTLPTDDWLCGLKLTHPVTGVSTLPSAAALPELQIAPNPATGNCTIKLSAPANEPALLTITDITGRLIQSLTTTTNKDTPLNLSTTPGSPTVQAGLYFVTATTPSGKCTTKLLIE
jgi:hypothetical protein